MKLSNTIKSTALLGFITLAAGILLSFKPLVKTKVKPRLCLTYDDGKINDMPGYTGPEWNAKLLANLSKNKVQAILFAKGSGLDNPNGKKVLESWSNAEHYICNHTYSHNSYNKSTFEDYKADFLKNDSLIRGYKNYVKMFRFPYLKEGDTKEKRDNFRNFLAEQHYQNGYVTIDASDWAVDARLVKRLKADPNADIAAYRQFYLDHLYEKAVFYNDLAVKLTGRQINHSLLLHHNLAAALFTDDLIQMFKDKGWEVINASEAYKDPVYKNQPDIVPAGESLIWGMAREKGTYNDIIRYPAEDSKYEEAKMDQLGL